MKRLTKEQVMLLHKILVKHTGGSDGVRDEGLLDSALAAPFMSFGDVTNFPTLESKAARLAFGIIRNHPFVDGNKRTGILVMLSFLEVNGINLFCSDDDLIELGLSLANGDIDDKATLDFIIRHN